MQYFRHVRNAAAHGNRFDVRSYQGRAAIDASNRPVWRSSVMQDDGSMDDRLLMGDWWDVGDVPIFLGDAEVFLRSVGIAP